MQCLPLPLPIAYKKESNQVSSQVQTQIDWQQPSGTLTDSKASLGLNWKAQHALLAISAQAEEQTHTHRA